MATQSVDIAQQQSDGGPTLGRTQTRRRILLVGNFAVSGNHSVGQELAERLPSRGHSVVVTTRRQRRVARLADMLATIWRRRSQYDVALVDVYSGLGFRLAEAACGALRFVRKPYVLALRGGNLPTFAKRFPKRARRLFASAAEVAVPSGYLLETMQPYCARLRLIPNPLEIARYPFTPRDCPRPRLVWMRAFHQDVYNPLLAPRVMELLCPRFDDVRLTMYGADKGDGSLAATRRLAEELGVADRIDFPGTLPKHEVPKRMAEADIILNTSNTDNMPISVMEAMALGLPVVSTDVGGIPYLLVHEENALLVPANNAPEMANAVRRLLTEPSLAGRLSRAARKVVEPLAWENILPQWDSVLRLPLDPARVGSDSTDSDLPHSMITG